jgi:PEP-CTERM/exosortase A-associated glycosyltransferase
MCCLSLHLEEKSVRILHIFDHSLPLQSGYVTRSLGIIRAQRARGWETIHLTTPRHPAAKSESETVDGLSFYRTDDIGVRTPILRELLEMRATGKRLVEIVRSERPDVIHAHSPVLNVLPALSAGKRFGLPVVYEVRALWEDAAVDHGTTAEGALRYRLSRMIDSRAMRRADCVAPICEPLRQEIIARGIEAGKVAVVPNAVDRSLLTEGPAAAGELLLREEFSIGGRTVLGFIGSFYGYEGLESLLRAAKRLRERREDFFVLLVGGGPEEARLKQLAAGLDLDGCVRFVGRVHHSEVQRYYRLVDLLVFPRKRMRLTDLVTPLKPLEAMAQLKPVLASDVGGHRELIRDGITGFLFPADDEAALASRLEYLIDNPAERARIAEQGRSFVAAERTWDRLMDRYAAIYESVGVKC